MMKVAGFALFALAMLFSNANALVCTGNYLSNDYSDFGNILDCVRITGDLEIRWNDVNGVTPPATIDFTNLHQVDGKLEIIFDNNKVADTVFNFPNLVSIGPHTAGLQIRGNGKSRVNEVNLPVLEVIDGHCKIGIFSHNGNVETVNIATNSPSFHITGDLYIGNDMNVGSIGTINIYQLTYAANIKISTKANLDTVLINGGNSYPPVALSTQWLKVTAWNKGKIENVTVNGLSSVCKNSNTEGLLIISSIGTNNHITSAVINGWGTEELQVCGELQVRAKDGDIDAITVTNLNRANNFNYRNDGVGSFGTMSFNGEDPRDFDVRLDGCSKRGWRPDASTACTCWGSYTGTDCSTGTPPAIIGGTPTQAPTAAPTAAPTTQNIQDAYSTIVGEMAFGSTVVIQGDIVLVANDRFEVENNVTIQEDNVDHAGGIAIFSYEAPFFEYQQIIWLDDHEEGDYWGYSADLSTTGTTFIAGAPFRNSDTGSVYIFDYDTTWTKTTNFTASDASPGLKFGISAALDGDYAVVGAHDGTDGAFYMFELISGVWTEVQKITQGTGNSFGLVVSMSGTTFVASDKDNNLVYVYTRDATSGNWDMQAFFSGSATGSGDEFGNSLDITGDDLIVGANGADDSYVFTRSGLIWSEEDIIPGYGGKAVAIDGDRLLVSGSYLVTRWIRTGTTWSHDAFIRANGITTGWGHSLSISSTITASTSSYASTAKFYLP